MQHAYDCAYNQPLETEWDPRKAEANWQKHRIRFADAVAVLEDERALTIRDPASGEDRWATLGMDALGRLLVVIYTWREKRCG